MCRYYPVIMIGSSNHGGRITCPSLQCMHRRILMQVVKHFLVVICSAIVVSPSCTCCELMVSQHIHHTNRRESHTEQFRTLCHHRSYKQATVRATGNSQAFRG